MLYLLGIPGANLKSFWVVCMVLVRCRDHLNMAVSWGWPVIVRVVLAVVSQSFKYILFTFWHEKGAASSTSSAVPTTPQKNLKAFASSCPTSSALWFERSSPHVLTSLMTLSAFKRLAMHYLLLKKVPIYNASKQPFLFQQDNFASMQGLPCYKKYGVKSWSDLPHQSLVSVFFTLNTYPKDYSSSSRADTGFLPPPLSPPITTVSSHSTFIL